MDDTPVLAVPRILQPEDFRKALRKPRTRLRAMAYAYTDLLVRCRMENDRTTELGVLNAIRQTFLKKDAKPDKGRIDALHKLMREHPLMQQREDRDDGAQTEH